jgi:hypothetical protein
MSHAEGWVLDTVFNYETKDWECNDVLLAWVEYDGTADIWHSTTWPTRDELSAHWRGNGDPTGGYRKCTCESPEIKVVRLETSYGSPYYCDREPGGSGNNFFCNKCKTIVGKLMVYDDYEDYANNGWGSKLEHAYYHPDWSIYFKLNELKEGDIIIDCSLSYGSGTKSWVVESGNIKTLDPRKPPKVPIYSKIERK